MEAGNVLDVFSVIGSKVGVPAALLVFWLYTKVKELTTRVEAVEKENEIFKRTLSDIRSDVSYIRGKLEGREDG